MSVDPLVRGPIDPQAIFVIRWVAVAGQLTALLFTHGILKFELHGLRHMVACGATCSDVSDECSV